VASDGTERAFSQWPETRRLSQGEELGQMSETAGDYDRKRDDNVAPPHRQNPKPRAIYDLVVVGGGTAGLVAAHGAAGLGARVALIEGRLLGGDCLNVGCVPSKAIIRSANIYAEFRKASLDGATSVDGPVADFPAVMTRMKSIRARLSAVDSVARLERAGVDVFFGHGRFTGPDCIDVDGSVLRFKKAMIATGARPDTPDIPGLEEEGYLTNETMFDIKELPRRLLVIGGGPLGCEMAQAFCRLGSQTTIVQKVPLFLPREERDAAQLLSESMARDGISVRLNTTAVSVRKRGTTKLVELISDDYKSSVEVDAILTGIGRKPNVEGLSLDLADVAYDGMQGIKTNDFLQTTNRRIYAAGDVCLEHKYTHTADASARIVVQNALFFGRKRLSNLIIPWCTYTDPEIAHVGLYVHEARELKIPVKTFTIPMHDVDRAILDGQENGFVKIHVREGTDRILGATIVARHASEMITEITVAMVSGIGLRRLSTVIHPYPTHSDAIRKAADSYNKGLLTSRLRNMSEWFLRR
jgi:pyruvate/2-oxoglutarate dehydrogenase complex dihydrolipoamide dehydrogenase (E3) component